MKKELLIFSLLLFLVINLTIAAEVSDITDSETLNNLRDAKKTLENPDEIKEKYLQKEWTKIFRESPYLSWIYKLNPIFRFLFGYEFALSWAFVTAMLIWLIIFAIYYPLMKQIFHNFASSLGIAIAISVITAQIAVPLIVEKLSEIIKSSAHNVWTIIFLVALIIVINYTSKIIQKEIEKKKIKSDTRTVREVSSEFKKTASSARTMKEGSDKYKKGE
jgi:hypothetical protein